ncbi:hypothetical protein GCM10010236_81370 [Streptomyces eurythermus]|nr:hypothetical protein GCM10010236_81370 [Streptomyces eurythermus]
MRSEVRSASPAKSWPKPTGMVSSAVNLAGQAEAAQSVGQGAGGIRDDGRVAGAGLGLAGITPDRVDGGGGAERDADDPGPAGAEANLDRRRGAHPPEPHHVAELDPAHPNRSAACSGPSGVSAATSSARSSHRQT